MPFQGEIWLMAWRLRSLAAVRSEVHERDEAALEVVAGAPQNNLLPLNTIK
jgi:hypothetical protein